jgi:hypothetical protein
MNVEQHPDAERLTLAALPAEDRDPGVEQHLSTCAECRERVDGLRRTVELARAGRGEPAVPPPRVWDAIAAELDDVDEVPAPVRSARSRARWGWRAVAVPAAAAVIGVAAGLGIGIGISPPTPAENPVPLAQLRPIGPADPSAAGTVDAIQRDGGQELVIKLEGVTDTEGGDYLEAWLIDAAGNRLVSLGALTASGATYTGEFTIPADLPMAEFNTVDISAERWDGDPTHSRISLLRGSVA